jgi:hypothetical protein
VLAGLQLLQIEHAVVLLKFLIAQLFVAFGQLFADFGRDIFHAVVD